MTSKTPLLIAAIAAGFALTVSAEARGFGGERGAMGPGMQMPGYDELDLNGDGALTPEEMQQAMQAQAQARFDAADTDGDGALSAQEMLAQAEASRANAIQSRIERMIARLDANEDGLIQADEMPNPGESRPGDRMFSRLDADEDGALSAEEFAAMEDMRGERRGPRGGHGHGRGN